MLLGSPARDIWAPSTRPPRRAGGPTGGHGPHVPRAMAITSRRTLLAHNCTRALTRALDRRVPLRSGGTHELFNC